MLIFGEDARVMSETCCYALGEKYFGGASSESNVDPVLGYQIYVEVLFFQILEGR